MAFFVLVEGALRLFGLGNPPVIGRLQFGYRTGIPLYDEDGIEFEGKPYSLPLFEADERLFWKPLRDTPFTGQDGFRKPVPQDQLKPAGVYRIGVVGDSCSFLGRQLYATQFADLVAEHRSGRVEVVNGSCPGYTSFQGVRRLDDLGRWDPDLVIVYFGWNDHWKSRNGSTDAVLSAKQAKLRTPRYLLRHLRLYQALTNLLHPPVAASDFVDAPVRVPPTDYRANLDRIAERARQQGWHVMFVTAPSLFVADQLPKWAFGFFNNYYNMTADQVRAIPDTHESYNQIVRKVADRHQHVTLVDLAKAWPAQESAKRFRSDGIHFRETGHRDAAQFLFGVWCRKVIADQVE